MSEDIVPPEKDIKDFKFQQLCKVRVTDSPSTLSTRNVSLLVSSSKYGLSFVGTSQGFKVCRTSDFVRLDLQNVTDRLKHIITDFPFLAEVTVGSEVSHLSLSCDDLTIAVVTHETDHTFVYMYDVRNFANNVMNVSPFLRVNLSGGDSRLCDMAWNPVVPTLLVTCLSSGRLDMFEITENLSMKASLPNAKATCVCWSPKGKQLVVARDDGSLMQYDPDLREKRKWDYPSVLGDAQYEALNVMWLSTYSFLVAYIQCGADCSDQPTVLLINGSKESPTTYANFEDLCYGTGEERERRYYFNYIQHWDVLLAGSSNASEIGVVGKHYDNKENWERWNLDDAARAECPLTEAYSDTYPMGIALDYSSQVPIALDNEKSHPPSPLVLVLSTEGLIIPYHMMYLRSDVPSINTPAIQLNVAGLRKPIASVPTPQPASVKNLFGSGDQSTAMPPFGAGLTNASSQSAAKPLFGNGLGATADQSASKPPFGAGLTSASNQPAGKALFGAAFAPSADQSTSKAAAGTGLGNGSFSFAASTPKSGGAAGFSFTSSTGAPAMAPAAPGNFSFNQKNTEANSPFSFAPKTTASSVSDAVGQSTGSAAGFGFTATSTPSAPFSFQTGTQAGPTPGSDKSLFSKPIPTTTAVPSPRTTTPAATGFAAASATSTALPAESTTGFGGFGQAAGKPSNFAIREKSSVDTKAIATVVNTKPVSMVTPSGAALGQGFGAKQPSVTLTTNKVHGSTGSLHKSNTQVTLENTGQGTINTGVPGPTAPSSTEAQPPRYQGRRARSPEVAPDTGENNISDTVDNAFYSSIMEEIHHFEREVGDLKQRMTRTDFSIGTRDDMHKLKKQTHDMEAFCDEIKTSVKEQSKEVEDQSALCLDMFAMTEECRTRQHLNADPKYYHLLKSRSLDPGSADKLQQLQLQYQVLDQGLRDVDLILDTQWEEYQNRKKNKSNRLTAPTNDAIYRVVKSNHNITLAQKAKLQALEERLKQLKLYNKTSAWNNTTAAYNRTDTTELSSLADSLVLSSPTKATVGTHSSDSSKTIPGNKLARLREHLYRRHVPVVRSTKPENLSMSRLVVQLPQSPEKSPVKPPASKAQPTTSRPGEFIGMARRSTAVPVIKPTTTNKPPSTGNGVLGQNLNTQAKNTGFTGQSKAQGLSGLTTGQNKAPGISGLTIGQAKASGFTGLTTTGSVANAAGSKLTTGNIGFSSQPLNKAPPNVTLPKTLQGFGLEGTTSRPAGAPIHQTVANVKEINGIRLEDITPSGSENDIEDTEEDDEYDDEDSSGSGSNGQGFGVQYNLTNTAGSTSTPVLTKPGPLTGAQTSTPVSRKLFGNDDNTTPTKPGFNFGAADSTPGGAGFNFGSKVKDTPTFTPAVTTVTTTTLQTGTKSSAAGFSFNAAGGVPTFGGNQGNQSDVFKTSVAQPGQGQPQPFTMTTTDTAKSSSSTSAAGFQVGAANTGASPFSFGGPASTTGGITGLFGKPKSTKVDTDSTVSSTTATPVSTNTPLLMSALIGSDSATEDNDGPPPAAPTPGASTPDTAVTSSQGAAISASTSHSTTTPNTSTNTGGLFGQATSSGAVTSTVTGLFGKTSDTTATSGGMFGKPGAGLFGQSTSSSTTTTPSSGGLFGQSTVPPDGLFGQSSATTSTTAGLFGQTATSASTGGLFGAPSSSSATTTGSSSSTGGLFGQPATSSSSGGLFGQPSTSSSSGGLFGQASTTPSTTSSTDTVGLFGKTSTATATTTGETGGLFGQAATTSTSGAGTFGQPATTTTAGGLFGQPASTSAGGLFGQAATTTASGGLFGAATTASSSGGLFGQSTTASPGGLFGQPASSTTSSGGLFGAAPTSGTGFGATTSGSGFGFGQTAAAPAFGKPAFGQSSGFGQSTSSSPGFGAPAGDSSSSGGGGGGGMFSGLGGKPSAEKASTNVFGVAQTFGTTPQTSETGLFGSSTSQTFGGGSSGGGLFSGAGGSGAGTFGSGTGVGATGFGSGQASTGFGGSPAFGGAPAFGSAPAFGAAPKFGSPPAFGSGGAAAFGTAPTFGSQPGGSTFGTTPAAGAGFAGFASAGSPSFGALAQSTDTPTFGALNQSGSGEGAPTGFGGGFGSPTFGTAGQQPAFGTAPQQPAFGSAPQQPAFGGGGGSTFGGSPSFSGHRG